LFEQAHGEGQSVSLPSADDYAVMRSRYVLAGRGTPPPGATPIRGERD
jgi:hypothetical protein